MPVPIDIQYNEKIIRLFSKLFSTCTVHTIRNYNPMNLNFPQFTTDFVGIHSVIDPLNRPIFDHTFWLSINFDPANLTFNHQKIFKQKYQQPCTVELRLLLWIDNFNEYSQSTALQLNVVNKLEESEEIGLHLYHPNYIVVHIDEKLKKIQYFINTPFETRAVIIVIGQDENS